MVSPGHEETIGVQKLESEQCKNALDTEGSPVNVKFVRKLEDNQMCSPVHKVTIEQIWVIF